MNDSKTYPDVKDVRLVAKDESYLLRLAVEYWPVIETDHSTQRTYVVVGISDGMLKSLHKQWMKLYLDADEDGDTDGTNDQP